MAVAVECNCETWLYETMDICGHTGIPVTNIRFDPQIDGPEGKGPLAAHFGLTHFVDDTADALLASVHQLHAAIRIKLFRNIETLDEAGMF